MGRGYSLTLMHVETLSMAGRCKSDLTRVEMSFDGNTFFFRDNSKLDIEFGNIPHTAG